MMTDSGATPRDPTPLQPRADAHALSQQGAVLVQDGKPELAIPVLEAALAMHKTAGDTLAIVDTANALGVCYRFLGRWADAEATYAEAVKIALASLPPNHLLLGVLFQNLGVLYGKIGRFGEAEGALTAALRIHRTTAHADPAAGRHATHTLDLLVALYERAGRIHDAAGALRDAIVPDARSLWRELVERTQLGRAELLRRHRATVDQFLSNVLLRWRDEAAAAAAGLDVLVWRRGFGLAPYHYANRAARTNPKLRSKLDQLKAMRAALAAEIFNAPVEPDRPHSLKVHWEGVGRSPEVDALEVEIFGGLSEDDIDAALNPPDCAAVAAALPADAALIEFWRCRQMHGDGNVTPRYLAFVLRPGDPPQVTMRDMCAADAIEDGLLATFLAALTGAAADATLPRHLMRHAVPAQNRDMPPDDTWRGLGMQLRRLILDPLQDALKGVKHLVIVPDGLLSRVPFAALPADDGGFVIDTFSVSYLMAGRDLCTDAPAGVRPGPSMVLANPAYSLGATGPADSPPGSALWFSDLPGAELEGRQVAARLGVGAIIGAAATERRLKECLSPLILHIATHGAMLPAKPLVAEFDIMSLQEFKVELRGSVQLGDDLGRLARRVIDDQALRSMLACAGVNTWLNYGTLPDDAEDGWLNAEDIAMIDLAGNELTVLSACETALGSVQIGEGVLGLRSAFHIAGARTVVMSLWLVDDEATREIMLKFYDHLIDGGGRAEALYLAQAALRKRYPNEPALWGAFICQGAPGPLSPQQRASLRKPSP